METASQSQPSSNVAPHNASDAVPEVLPGVPLTGEQWMALQALEAFVNSDEKLYLLTGYAGTGKTTLLQVLLNRFRQQRDRRKVVLTAFSNKATKVLSQMASFWGLDIDCMTCCQLLALKPVIDDESGKQVFQSDRKQASQIDRFRLVIVDECSMINEEMWGLLVNAVSNLHSRTQLLFVGDAAQLPPVGEPESPCFSQIYHRSDLTQVVRYGGAIGVLAEDIRRNLERDRFPRFRSNTNAERTEGCFALSSRQQWETLMLKAFTSEAYQRNPDQVRALAYTNRRVNQLNQKIRTAIYGSNAPRFVPGERLIAINPCLEEEAIVLPTSAECEVLQVVKGREGKWPVWFLEIETEEGKFKTLRVLHESGVADYQLKLNTFAQEKRWQEFWDLKQFFHEVDYAYSLTIHKSQGSTFQDVFVDLPSMRSNPNVVERNQLCYVAFTRAAKRLFILQ
ncbi:MAG TPA: DEAD/DEAH box helicase [Leptolyngbyaceae cyanobacterium]